MANFLDRLEHAWNAFRGDPKYPPIKPGGESYSGAIPQRRMPSYYTKASIITPIITRLAMDAAAIELKHVRVDDNNTYREDIMSGLYDCLIFDPNLDQSPAQFRQDLYETMLESGVAAIVPVETDVSPEMTGGYDIKQIRVGTVRQWYPEHVMVNVYDQREGVSKDIILPKRMVSLVTNPLYKIMNSPNSTLQRLLKKLSQLDVTDDRIASGKLDLLFQLPYTVRHETRKAQADKRLRDLEDQLQRSTYGMGYIDSTEKVTQLNRPVENNLYEQVTRLEDRLYAQLGYTPEILNGSADEATMLNYETRSIQPLVKAVTEEMTRKFLTKTARTQKQRTSMVRDPFRLVPISSLADIADKFTRNEVLTPNEVRAIIAMKPVADQDADKLRNRNMPDPDAAPKEDPKPEPEQDERTEQSVEEA